MSNNHKVVARFTMVFDIKDTGPENKIGLESAYDLMRLFRDAYMKEINGKAFDADYHNTVCFDGKMYDCQSTPNYFQALEDALPGEGQHELAQGEVYRQRRSEETAHWEDVERLKTEIALLKGAKPTLLSNVIMEREVKSCE